MADRNLPIVAILAGGLATRLGGFSNGIPKALVEVAGKPFLFHLLDLIRLQGIDRVLICAGHLGEKIVETVGDGRAFGLSIRFSMDGPALLGTAGALRNAKPFLDETFFVLNGDTYLETNYAEVYRCFLNSGAMGLMTVYENGDRHEPSNVEFETGQIRAYSKDDRTPEMRHVDCGLGVLRREALDRIPDGARYDLAMLYQSLLQEDQLAAFEVSERYFEIGTPGSMSETDRFLRRANLERVDE